MSLSCLNSEATNYPKQCWVLVQAPLLSCITFGTLSTTLPEPHLPQLNKKW